MINSFTMKSFKDYVNYRSKMSVLEMAAPAISIKDDEGKEKKIREIKRTPIFMDQDEIYFLNQLPPFAWKQALQLRYSKLLYDVHQSRIGKKPPVSDVQDIKIRGPSSLSYIFKNIDTKINELYDKLNADSPSAMIYRGLRHDDPNLSEKIKQRKEELSKKLGKRVGDHGFNFEGFVCDDTVCRAPKAAAEGYVAPGVREIDEVLGRYFKGYEQGWHDDDLPADHVVAKVNLQSFGEKEKGAKRSLPVSPQMRTWVEGKDFVIEGGKSKGKSPEVIRTYQPILFPGFKALEKPSKKVELLKTTSELIKKEIEKDIDISEYLKLIRPSLDPKVLFTIDDDFIQKAIARRDKMFSKKKTFKGKSPKAKQPYEELYAKYNKFVILGTTLKNSKYKMQYKKILENELQNGENKVTNWSDRKQVEKCIAVALAKFLEIVLEKINKRISKTIKSTKKLSVDQFNTMQYSDLESGTQGKLRDFGSYQSNKQQSERNYQSTLMALGDDENNISKFWEHLTKDLLINDEIEKGINRKIDLYSRSTKTAIPEITKLIAEEMENYKSFILREAKEQLRYKTGSAHFLKYAESFMKNVIEGNMDPRQLPEINNKLVSKIKLSAQTEGLDFCNSIIQLLNRFLASRYNRTFRPESPYQGHTVKDIVHAYSIGKIIDFGGYRQSHSIEVLKEIINDVESAPIEFDKNLSVAKNADEKEKSAASSIFKSIISKIAGFFKKQKPQQPTGQQPTGFKLPIKQKPKQDKPSTFLGFKPPWQK